MQFYHIILLYLMKCYYIGKYVLKNVKSLININRNLKFAVQ